ncbi:MAG: hypothetical protein WAW59_02020 [Patescibacteria group bacterium]
MASASKILEDISRTVDMTSYYVSTQTKIQFFLAIIKEAAIL